MGSWEFDRENGCLSGPYEYYIPLDRCRTSAEVLDWIFQISHKTWCTPETLADLIEAFRVVVDPQARLCGSGVEHGPINVLDAWQ